LLRRTATSAFSRQIVFGQLAASCEPVGLLSSAPKKKIEEIVRLKPLRLCGHFPAKCNPVAARKCSAAMKCAYSDRRREAHEALREAIHPDTFHRAASC
jgi:hypothetical protein